MNRTEGNNNSRRNLGARKNALHAAENGESSVMANPTTTTILRTDSHSPDLSSRTIYRISEARSRADPVTFSPVSTMSGSGRGTIRKKQSSNSASTSTYTTAATSADEMVVDFGRVKVKHTFNAFAPVSQSSQSRLANTAANHVGTSTASAHHHHIKKEKSDNGKQRSKSRDAHPQSARRAIPIEPGKDDAKEFGVTETQSNAYVYSGPLAVAEFERMKKEIETLKKVVYNNKKDMKKQFKVCRSIN